MNTKMKQVIESTVIINDKKIVFNKIGSICSFCSKVASYTASFEAVVSGENSKIKINCCETHFVEFSKKHPTVVNNFSESNLWEYTFRNSELFRTSSILNPVLPVRASKKKSTRERIKEEKAFLDFRREKNYLTDLFSTLEDINKEVSEEEDRNYNLLQKLVEISADTDNHIELNYTDGTGTIGKLYEVSSNIFYMNGLLFSVEDILEINGLTIYL